MSTARALLLLALLALGGGACRARTLATGQCVFNADCPSAQVCFNNQCRQACRTVRDCPQTPQAMRCDPAEEPGLFVCVPATDPQRCVYHSQCDTAAGQVCGPDGLCRPQCRSDIDCQALRPGTRCALASPQGGTCVAAQDAGVEAGCPSSSTLCGSRCAELQSDPRSCGACDRDCTRAANVSPTAALCTAGRCDLARACLPGWGDCDNDPSNGCERDLSQASSCGACAALCAAGSVCAPQATDGGAGFACAAGCPSGTVNCGGRCADTSTEVLNCGACGRACVAPPHMVASCASGACAYVCAAGWADCDRDASNGCEVDTTSDDAHCGSCATACAPAHGTGRCVSSLCALARCDANYDDCDRDASNGCEADLRADGRNCGVCGTACGAPNSTFACAAGVCTLRSCAPGFASCDGDPSNGCEADLNASPLHCGACGASCVPPRGTGACMAGRCTVTACTPPYRDCDGVTSNGCETDTSLDAANCGACGTACSLRNGTAVCAAGACAPGACSGGFSDCDRDPSNGCEVDPRSDVNHCGGCGLACAPPNARGACVGGGCSVGSCLPGYADCDGVGSNGCELFTDTDPNNCGACGRRCSFPNAAGACVAGACRLGSCFAGYGDCNGVLADGCEVELAASPSNCGGCGNVCGGANATGLCSAGSCQLFCAPYFDNCDGVTSNGCETDLRASTANCGRCGSPCPTPANGTSSCQNGVCVVTPAAGYTCTGASCAPSAPRQLAPLTAHRTTQQAPTLRFAAPSVATAVEVTVCADPGCGSVEASATIAASSYTLPSRLAAGVHFWRLRTLVGAALSAYSPTWSFVVPRRDAPGGPDRSWGTSVDLDGDGLSDLLSGSNAGGWWFRGLRSPTNMLMPVPEAPLPGGPLAVGGDVNGDGYSDAILVANGGPLQVYLGNPVRVAGPPTTIAAPTGVSGFGTALAPAGDVNGDGFADVLVGSWYNQQALLYFGSASGLVATPRIFTGPTQFGFSVALAGDVNGDGYADLLVGSCVNGGSPSCSAVAHLFHGGPGGPSTTPSAILTGLNAEQYSVGVAGLGDVNGDGYDDVGVYANGARRIYLYQGGPGGVGTTPVGQLDSPGGGIYFGWSFAGVGDVDADGYDDVLVGRYNDGYAFLYRGSATGLRSAVYSSITNPSGSYAWSVGAAGDLNGDGLPEAFVGSTGGSYYVEALRWNAPTGNLVVVGTARASGVGNTVAQRLRRWLLGGRRS